MPDGKYRDTVQTLLAASLLALVTLAAACADGGGDSGPTLAIASPTVTVGADEPTATVASNVTSTALPTPLESPTASATPNDEGIILLTCGDILAPLDKQHALAENCAPTDLVDVPEALQWGSGLLLRADAAAALEQMLTAASEDGHDVRVRSAYRSYATQVSTFQQNVDLYGLEEALRQSAKAGHSEHQLGMTVDLTSAAVGWELDQAFGATLEGTWIAENSWKYGFVVSYQQGTEHITGYLYEPWHVRYIGVDVAADVWSSGLTLHEYLLQ